jgi:hypothetical protein
MDDPEYDSDESSVTVHDDLYYIMIHVDRHDLLRHRVGLLLDSLLLTYFPLAQLLYVIEELTFFDPRLIEALELFYWFVVGVRNRIGDFNDLHEDIERRFGESNLANPRARHFFQMNMEEREGALDNINHSNTTAIETWLTENASEFLILPDFPDVDVDALN